MPPANKRPAGPLPLNWNGRGTWSIPVISCSSGRRQLHHQESVHLLLESDEHEPTNIGNPDERTILEVHHHIIEVTGSSGKIVFDTLSTDDPKARQPDISKARRVLGWELRMVLHYFRKASASEAS